MSPEDEEFQRQVEQRVRELVTEFSHATDRVSAISCAAWLDDALGAAIGTKFIPLGVDWKERVFDNTLAPLSTFYAKIVIGYAMGIYGPVTRADMDLIRQVRNVFAHTPHRIDFEHSEVAPKCLKLKISRLNLGDSVQLTDEHNPKQHYVASSLRIGKINKSRTGQS